MRRGMGADTCNIGQVRWASIERLVTAPPRGLSMLQANYTVIEMQDQDFLWDPDDDDDIED